MLVERTRQIDLQHRVLLAFRERAVPESVRALGREQAAFQQAFRFVIEADIFVGHGVSVSQAECESKRFLRELAQMRCDLVGAVCQVSAEKLVRTFSAQGYSRFCAAQL